MAVRAQLIAELASNHCGDFAPGGLAETLIKAAADSGADFVKIQLFDASLLRDDDPQKAFLQSAQVDRAALDFLLNTAALSNVQLTASVFGIPQAQMAKDAGLTTIKIGSGDSGRTDLNEYCASHFDILWISGGLYHPRDIYLDVVFHGISQYPALPARNLARLLQCDKSGPWGWSDHGETLDVACQALSYGCTYLERHFALPHTGRRQAWDSIPTEFARLRKWAESVAWEGSEQHDEACKKYLTRWTGDQIEA